MARGTVEARGHGAIVDVFRAVSARPAVNADARVAAYRVGARGAILAHTGSQGTFVHVLGAVRSCVRGRAVARVRVHAVQTRCAVLAQVARAVVHVRLAVGAREAGRARTLVVERVDGPTRPTIHAGARLTRDVLRFAKLSRVPGFTNATEGTLSVEARPMNTRSCLALVHVHRARGSAVPRSTDARIRVLLGLAAAVIQTRLRRAVVNLVAVLASEAVGAHARVVLQSDQLARSPVMAGLRVAGVGHLDLAHGGRVAHGTCARERGSVCDTHLHVARASVLAAETRAAGVARIRVLTVLADVERRTVAMRLAAGV